MRILICISTLGTGGAERDVAFLAPELRRRGHDVRVAYTVGGPNLQPLTDAGVPTYHVGGGHSASPLLLWRLVRLVRDFQPDVVHTWLTQMDVAGGLAARLMRTPHLLTELSSASAYPRSWRHRLRVTVARGATTIVANSQGGADYWRERLPGARLAVIPHGLPLAEIGAALPALPPTIAIRDGQRLVLFVGRLHSDKNLETLVRALNMVLTDKSVVAVLSGDGPSRERLTELARGGGHSDRLLVPGFLGGLWSMLKRADVFVSVSAFEGRPNAVLEAMACGCPVVVSDIPAHREILSNECALFVDGSDVGAIAAAIRCALNDPAAARARAQLAEARTADWSVSAMAARYEEVYRQLVTSPRLSKP